MKRIGVDLGGTSIRAALVDENGIVRKVSTDCPADAEDPNVVLDAIATLIGEIICDEVYSIGIGVPSVVDADNGIVYDAINIPSWKEVHLKDYLEMRFPGVKVSVNNDANCYAIAHTAFGVGKGHRSLVALALGTGTGAGITIDGKIYNGANVGAGEVGMLPYLDSVYEDYTSGAFFRKRGTDGRTVAAHARGGDRVAIELYCELGRHIGSLIKTIVLAYDPEVVVIGGGIACASDLFESSMRESLKDFCYPHSIEQLGLFISELNDAALLGAAALN